MPIFLQYTLSGSLRFHHHIPQLLVNAFMKPTNNSRTSIYHSTITFTLRSSAAQMLLVIHSHSYPNRHNESVCVELITALCSGTKIHSNRVGAIYACAHLWYHKCMIMFSESNRYGTSKEPLCVPCGL